MINTYLQPLPHGITLSCRSAGEPGRPVLVFLHGFPEGAFVWDAMLAHFSKAENGGYRCVAPNLRGFEQSSAPSEVSAYRPKHLVQDIAALVAIETGGTQPLACLVAHDWGGAIAWNFANQLPHLADKLAIINSPHPGTFLRELKSNPAQQQASAYMNFLCRPDAEALLAAGGHARLWPFFGAAPAWLTPEMREQYLASWKTGLTGPLNYYRASPLRPATEPDDPLHTLAWPDEAVTVRVPTTVLWGECDQALLPALLHGLERWVPELQVRRVPEASHWIVHEQPALVADQIRRLLPAT